MEFNDLEINDFEINDLEINNADILNKFFTNIPEEITILENFIVRQNNRINKLKKLLTLSNIQNMNKAGLTNCNDNSDALITEINMTYQKINETNIRLNHIKELKKSIMKIRDCYNKSKKNEHEYPRYKHKSPKRSASKETNKPIINNKCKNCTTEKYCNIKNEEKKFIDEHCVILTLVITF